MKNSLLLGLGFSIACGLIYFLVLREPGSLFYPFVALAFVGGPCIAGLLAAQKMPLRKIVSFFITGVSAFGVVCVLFLLMYAILPVFERTSVQLSAFCDGSYDRSYPSTALAYILPNNKGTGILVASDEKTAVVAVITQDNLPNSAEVYLVDKSSNRVLWMTHFPNDAIMAVVSNGIVYLYNDKLGYFLDARTGAFKENILLIDNYGGLSQSDRPVFMGASDGNWYVETSAVISSWGVDGSVHSRPHLILNAIARGCFVNGQTGEVTKLSID